MAPRSDNERPNRLAIAFWNSDGNPAKKPLFHKLLNSPKYCNHIFLLNDIRLQRGEETAIRARFHHVEIANQPTRKHSPGGVAMLVPKGTFVQLHTDGSEERILATLKIEGKTIVVATEYVHPREKIGEDFLDIL